jgi:hypothetical protein
MIYNIYTYTPQNIYMRLCKCISQIFTLASCKYKKFRCVSVNDLRFQEIYTSCIYKSIDTYTYTHNTDMYCVPQFGQIKE